MTSLPLITFLDASRTEGELKTSFYGPMLDVAAELPGGGIMTELTIAAGSVTPPAKSSRQFRIDTEANAATDDLDHIDVTNVPDGGHILLRAEAGASRTVKVVHGAGGSGQIMLNGDKDLRLDSIDKHLWLRRQGTDWVEVMRDLGGLSWAHKQAEILNISAAKTLTRDDDGRLHNCASAGGTFTVTLPPLADVPDGALYGFRKVDTSANKVTIDGNAADLIDVDQTFELLVKDHVVWVMSDTASWVVVGHSRRRIREVFTAGGTWTKPKGVTSAFALALASGGGGGAGSASVPGNGGGAGGSAEGIYDVSALATVTVTIGAAGTAGTAGGAGGNGNTSSFGALCSATGGTGGFAASGAGGLAGSGSGGDVNLTGGPGMGATSDGDQIRKNGGAAPGRHGGGGGRGVHSGAGQNGGNYGSGGGGGGVSADGGAGAGGLIVVEY